MSLLAAVPFAAMWPARALARAALTGSCARLWKSSCSLTALRGWGIAALLVVWLAVGLHLKWLTTQFGIGVVVALVVGVIAGSVFTPFMNVPQAYWKMLHNSLAKALKNTPGAQQTSFNGLHKRLLEDSSDDRRVVLGRIIAASETDVTT